MVVSLSLVSFRHDNYAKSQKVMRIIREARTTDITDIMQVMKLPHKMTTI